MSIKIRKANLKNKNDFDFVVDCEHTLQDMHSKKYHPKSVRSNVAKMIKSAKKSINLIVLYNNQKVGYLQYFFNERFKYPQIDSLFVLEKFRNKGIGKKMMDYIGKIARYKKCRFIRLYVEKLNSKGIEFYKKNGYKIAAYKMEKEL